ncbi:embryonic stem cell-specific 5-hydroxymethylcytosine-binding protein [Vombatus ursinus]|uniref:Abasic site processing protein HMCES n=1 Tax=Vombatus ursinus TaxID=29139 RepID=A0A4X2LLH6_VOMUR|nr:embryonic stem cell-specific 5-hydroxymethylcytosine-binding protein [Vombatus ursinus]XP_027719717.1 embryonic stem cell-specific 5-hydroxymethylcytosine-binding protein [Vombatus ursinus]
MCGRTSCHLPVETVRRACSYIDSYGQEQLPDWKDEDKYFPSYNKSPQSNSPVLLSRLHFEKDADPCDRVIAAMRWGLIPSWFREADASKMQFSTSNCRSETMMERRSYKVPLEKGRRCVVLADGFFEWQQFRGEKQPYFIYFPQIKTEQSFFSRSVDEEVWDDWRLLTMAGIFDCWQPPNGGEPLYSYTVITVDSCKALSDIHHRMPALLDGEEAIAKWLDFGEVPIYEALKVIRPVDNITFHPVSTIVNNSLNNTPQCLEPVEIEEMPYIIPSRRKMTPKSPSKEDPDPPKRSRYFALKSSSSQRASAELMERWLKKHETRHNRRPKF